MLAYVVRRLLHVVPVLLGVSVVVFLTMKLVPGDQAEALLGPQATPEGMAQIRHALGTSLPRGSRVPPKAAGESASKKATIRECPV